MENYMIQEWDSSYYCWEKRAWIYGKLTLCSEYICFFVKNNSEPRVSADLRRVTGFQRRLVSLVYRAIVVSVDGEKPLWFSSLNNREEVFYFLEHFWKERLLYLGPRGEQKQQTSSHGITASSASEAERRKKLFEVLYDSEDTLIKASDSLYNQGEQLNHSSCMMNKVHKDLNVTETLISGLDRWFTKWDIKLEYFYEIQTKKEYPILYRKSTKESYYPGTLVLVESQVRVLDVKRVADVSIVLKDLSNIIVNSPWNIVFVRSVIGEVDVMIDISSAQVIYILKVLQKDHGHKFHYEEVSLDAKQIIKIPQMPGFSTQATEQLDFDTGEDTELTMDAADLERVCDVVGNMKSMAIGINQEMKYQLDSLDQLSESVDKANYRIRKGSRKVQENL